MDFGAAQHIKFSGAQDVGAAVRHRAGIILVDKESGSSSAAIVGRLKRRFGFARIGHSGTLDPMATGLLVLLTNGATRLARYAEGGRKKYSGVIRLGIETSSDDISGEIIESSAVEVSAQQVQDAVPEFLGLQQQLPPRVSAIKIAGERAYKRQRRGEEFEMAARKVEVYSLDVKQCATDELEFAVECSKGFYVRAFARDLGRKLGCLGTLAALRREESAPFSVFDAKHAADIENCDIFDWRCLFPGCAELELSGRALDWFLNGDRRVFEQAESHCCGAALQSDCKLVCVCSSGAAVGLLERTGLGWQFVFVDHAGISGC